MPERDEADVASTVSARSRPARTALILYGSETGNSQDVADEIGRLMSRLHFEIVILDLDSVQLRDLLKFTTIIFVVSTTGQGEFPQNARTLWRALRSSVLKPGVLRKVRFTSFGLGDSSYPRYNVAHRMLHGRMLQLGAACYCERGEGNEQHPEGHSAGFREWVVRLKTSLLTAFPLPDGQQPLSEGLFIEPSFKLELGHNSSSFGAVQDVLEHPSTALLPIRGGFAADVVDNVRVTTADHFQDVRLFDLRVAEEYNYGPGAVAVVYPKNFPEDVQNFINLMHWDDIADAPLELKARTSDETILTSQSPLRHFDLAGTPVTMRWLLENALDIMAIPRRSFFATLANFAGDADDDQAYQKERLLELANPELIDELWDYTTRPKRTILEVMMDFTTVKIPWQYALSTLPVMRGRQFSIASGGDHTKDDLGRTRVELLVAIVDPPSPIIKWRRRYGVCTRYMLCLQAGQQIRIQLQPGYLDVQPNELNHPVVMIGPGTGIAPMRAMVQQRLRWAHAFSSSAIGKRLQDDMLFFGCRSSSADYFFHDEWQQLAEVEGLRFHAAFSRDPKQSRQYVQDQIRIHAASVASSLLDRGGKVYVCGSSGNMPKGVRAALADALATTSLTQNQAEAYLDEMEKTGRYKQETW
ncbi:hypothetical protein AMS68_006529 [Peltaster fructicola]|uniref:NADPH-dependent diflavin oxidoreductase 1 n=1 Tax=Peltaster fructicola TaxID=286661 RepID=A0A6H0Y1W6_9PEZI|nr:hypothetical protein AMS68_006529 [Peltaster fructicola]